jgi:hypothetical protein
MERARLAAEQHSSGKSQIACCEEHGISTKTFRRWVQGVRGGNPEDKCAVNWMEVNGYNSPPDLTSMSDAVIEILVGTYTVRVKPGIDRETMSDICRMLGERC